ncbi:hypothetical protein CW304_14800 [Bacillus sp. UFRGS-B20]|nr:hypothetical protein CW304_14800 [Bacillus sp. UFRGS-B20]
MSAIPRIHPYCKIITKILTEPSLTLYLFFCLNLFFSLQIRPTLHSCHQRSTSLIFILSFNPLRKVKILLH